MSHHPNDDDLSARLRRVRGEGWPPAGSGQELRGRADRQRRRRTAYAGGGVVVVAAAAVGLTIALQDSGTATVAPPGGPLATATSTPTTSATASPTTSGGPTTTPTPAGPTATAPAATPRCLTPQLSAALTQSDAGAGQRYAFLRLTNTGTTGCRIQGFGGVELRSSTGTVLATQARDHSAPAPTTLVAPGAVVASRLHWTVIPGTGDPTDGTCSPGASVLVVTPPNETHPLQLPWSLGPVCGMRIDQQAYVAAR